MLLAIFLYTMASIYAQKKKHSPDSQQRKDWKECNS